MPYHPACALLLKDYKKKNVKNLNYHTQTNLMEQLCMEMTGSDNPDACTSSNCLVQ